MSGALPPSLELTRAARQAFDLEGRLAVKSMPRLVAALASDAGTAEFELHAGVDLAKRVVVSGRIDAELELVCQRCLGPVKVALHAEPYLAWVKTDEALAALPDEYDPLLSVDGRVALADVVTDELLLALPLVPRHEGDAACRDLPEAVVEPAAAEEERKNPFAELAKLKRGR
ncbi:MAG TPA: YceD family protein [Gammaproteobacteria bacterium]|nr:YceD family protein [Gammaproteobacteria bacterium]